MFLFSCCCLKWSKVPCLRQVFLTFLCVGLPSTYSARRVVPALIESSAVSLGVTMGHGFPLREEAGNGDLGFRATLALSMFWFSGLDLHLRFSPAVPFLTVRPSEFRCPGYQDPKNWFDEIGRWGPVEIMVGEDRGGEGQTLETARQHKRRFLRERPRK